MNKSSLLGKSNLFMGPTDLGERGRQVVSIIREGNFDWVSKCCDRDDLNVQDSKSRTLLYYACYYNKPDILLFLINKGLPISQLDSEGRNIWHVCAYSGSSHCFSILLSHGECLRRIIASKNLKQALQKYRFKKSDYKQGELTSTTSQQRVKEFQLFKTQVRGIVDNYFNSRLWDYSSSLNTQDSVQSRTPIHLGSLNKSQKCFQVLEMMLRQNPNQYDDYLELNERISGAIENYEDPRIYNHVLTDISNVISEKEYADVEAKQRVNFGNLVKSTINLKDKEGFTALHLASYQGSSSISILLKKLGANISDSEDKEGQNVVEIAKNNTIRGVITNLCQASQKGDNQTINLLISCGQDINAKKTIFGVTPLYNSILYCQKSNDIVPTKTLLQNGADIGSQDVNGWTSLHKASQVGNLQMVQLLLTNGASTRRASNKGWLPLHIAASNDHYEIVQLFKSKVKNLDLQAKDHDGCTPLILASKKGCNKTIRTLMEMGANLYAQDNKKMNSLHYATFKQHIDTIKALLYFDADHDKLRSMKNCHGKPAKELSNDSITRGCFDNVWSASREGKLDVLRRLILEGADKDGQTFHLKRTPLMYSVLGGHYLLAKYLLQQGASTYPQDSEGQTVTAYVSLYLESVPTKERTRAKENVSQIKKILSSFDN